MEKKSKLAILTNGIIKENPVLVLLLGTCPFLATSSSLINALGMGLSATAVLICSNIVISMLRKVIPDKVRIPCYIVVIAGFVTLVQFVLQAYAPDICPGAALNRLATWIKTNKQLTEALKETNYRVNQQLFTSRQVALIFEYLGEP
jgi:Na+-translocating ferredoxin:NAD+ oxidoreductase RnfE subunit